VTPDLRKTLERPQKGSFLLAGEFVLTIGSETQIPDTLKGIFLKGRREPRIAMVGRSNVGKSSLINALLGTRLAQVSKEPGKTRAIHFYFWKDAGKIIADLPGYGYARAGHEERERWATFIGAYLRADEGLDRAFVLLDARHGPTELDLDAMRFLAENGIPMTAVFTKADVLKTQSERAIRKRESLALLKELGFGPDNIFWVSARGQTGLQELLRAMK